MTLSILRWLMPFVWEWVLGKQGLKEAIRTNKKKVLVFLLVMGSLGLNGFMTSRVVTLAAQNLDLRNQLHDKEIRKGRNEQPIADPPGELPPIGKFDHISVIRELENIDKSLKGGYK